MAADILCKKQSDVAENTCLKELVSSANKRLSKAANWQYHVKLPWNPKTHVLTKAKTDMLQSYPQRISQKGKWAIEMKEM